MELGLGGEEDIHSYFLSAGMGVCLEEAVPPHDLHDLMGIYIESEQWLHACTARIRSGVLTE